VVLRSIRLKLCLNADEKSNPHAEAGSVSRLVAFFVKSLRLKELAPSALD
jgi:hypothetical protein